MTKATTNDQEVVDHIEGIIFVDYKDETQLDSVMSMVGRDLSEPYSSECVLVLCMRVCMRVGP
jgi:hypothetical protein